MKEKKKGIGRKVTIFAVKRIKLLYIIEIVYIYALYMIIKPVFFKVLTGLLHLHGYSYLTNEMMLSFFGNFDVIVILLLMFFTTGILGSILYGYMYEYISMRMTDTMINHRTLLKRTKKIMTKCLKQHPAKMIFLVVGSLLFRNILAIMIAGRYVPNVWYILKNILNFSYMRYVVIIATFGIIVYFFRNFFLMEGMFIYGDSNKIAKETGKILWKNKRKESITLWIFGNIVTVVFIIVFYFVLVGITIGIIVLFIPKTLRIAVFCTIQEHLYKITFWRKVESALKSMKI